MDLKDPLPEGAMGESLPSASCILLLFRVR